MRIPVAVRAGFGRIVQPVRRASIEDLRLGCHLRGTSLSRIDVPVPHALPKARRVQPGSAGPIRLPPAHRSAGVAAGTPRPRHSPSSQWRVARIRVGERLRPRRDRRRHRHRTQTRIPSHRSQFESPKIGVRIDSPSESHSGRHPRNTQVSRRGSRGRAGIAVQERESGARYGSRPHQIHRTSRPSHDLSHRRVCRQSYLKVVRDLTEFRRIESVGKALPHRQHLAASKPQRSELSESRDTKLPPRPEWKRFPVRHQPARARVLRPIQTARGRDPRRPTTRPTERGFPNRDLRSSAPPKAQRKVSCGVRWRVQPAREHP